MLRLTILTLFVVLCSVITNAQHGFVITGKLPGKPDDYQWFPNNTLYIKSEGRKLLLDTTGHIIATAAGFRHFENDLIIADSLAGNSDYVYSGIINTKGEIVIPRMYHFIGPLINDRAVVQKGNGKFGYINGRGEEVLPVINWKATDFYKGVAAVAPDFRNYGFIDFNGNVLLAPRDPSGPLKGIFNAKGFRNGFCVINTDLNLSVFNIVSIKGKNLLPPSPTAAEALSPHLVLHNKILFKYGADTDSLIPTSIDYKFGLDGRFFVGESDHTVSIYNMMGTPLFTYPTQYKSPSGFNGASFVTFNTITKAIVLLDSTGRETASTITSKIPIKDAYSAYRGYTAVLADNLWGFLNAKGKMVVPPQFTNRDWYNFVNGIFTFAEYRGEWVILRLKSETELRREEQLIAQKKMPTAEQCFAQEKEWLLAQKQAKEDPDRFAKENTKDKILLRNLSAFKNQFINYNEGASAFMKAESAALKGPRRSNCTDFEWRLSADANSGVIKLIQNLQYMSAEIEKVKAVDYAYLCSENRQRLLDKLGMLKEEIDRFLRNESVVLSSKVNYLQTVSAAGNPFGRYNTELESLNRYITDKIDTPLNSISGKGTDFFNLAAGCK